MRLFHPPSLVFFFVLLVLFCVNDEKFEGCFSHSPSCELAGSFTGIDLPVLLENELKGKNDKRPATASFPWVITLHKPD